MPISGKDALAFLAGVEKAMDEAGGGKFRAFNLLAELERIGLGIVSLEQAPDDAPKDATSAVDLS